MGAEGGQRLLDALLVADVGKDAVETGKDGFVGGDVQSGVGQHGQQAGGFQRHGLAAGVGAGNQQDAPPRVQRQADGNYAAVAAGQQRMPGAAEAHPARRCGIGIIAAIAIIGQHHRGRGP